MHRIDIGGRGFNVEEDHNFVMISAARGGRARVSSFRFRPYFADLRTVNGRVDVTGVSIRRVDAKKNCPNLEKQVAYAASRRFATAYRSFRYILAISELIGIDETFDCITLIEVIDSSRRRDSRACPSKRAASSSRAGCWWCLPRITRACGRCWRSSSTGGPTCRTRSNTLPSSTISIACRSFGNFPVGGRRFPVVPQDDHSPHRAVLRRFVLSRLDEVVEAFPAPRVEEPLWEPDPAVFPEEVIAWGPALGPLP